MSSQTSRLSKPVVSTLSEGWKLERVTAPSRLHGANGIRTGADGRIYVAQVTGSRISALDPDTGEMEDISAIDGPITAPDDLVFDDEGNLFVTEITLGKVSMLGANGSYRVINDDLPVANPITFHQGKLIAGECRMGGRVMELDRETGAQRMILTDAPMPNAFTVGPDGKLYMPMMATNEIWRISLDGGEPEVVAKDLGVPDSVKFDSKGRIISTQVASGQVLRIDPATGAKEVLANIAPGLDNCTFVGDRLFVSSISGQVNEILDDGKVRSLVKDGLQWPMGLAVGSEGEVFIADGAYSYLLHASGERQFIGFFFTPGYPGFARGVAADGPGSWLVSTSNGQVMKWTLSEQASEPIADGLMVPFGVARLSSSEVVVADGGSGKVVLARKGQLEDLATGLMRPMGLAVSSDGSVFVSENKAGRVLKLAGSRTETVIDGLKEPQGIAISGDTLFVLDAEDRSLIRVRTDGSDREVIASGLPVKSPAGVTPKILGGVEGQAGPMEPFAGVAVAPDGSIYISGDAEGSVLKVSRAN